MADSAANDSISPAIEEPSLEPEDLRLLEWQLVRIIGPIGQVFVRQCAPQVADIPALIDAIAARLASPAERAALNKGCAALRARTALDVAPTRQALALAEQRLMR